MAACTLGVQESTSGGLEEVLKKSKVSLCRRTQTQTSPLSRMRTRKKVLEQLPGEQLRHTPVNALNQERNKESEPTEVL